MKPLFIQPVRAGDFLERVNCSLDSFGPCDRNELDVSVHVANREDSLPGCFEIRIDRDAAIFVQSHPQSLECILRGKKADLDDSHRAVDVMATRHTKPDLLSGEFCSLNFRRYPDCGTRITNASERIRLSHRNRLADDQIDMPVSSQNHECRIERGIPTANDRDVAALVIPNLRYLVL